MHSYENRSRELIHVQAQAAIHGNVETRTMSLNHMQYTTIQIKSIL